MLSTAGDFSRLVSSTELVKRRTAFFIRILL